MRYQKSFTPAQPIKVEIEFDGIVPAEINVYALVLTNETISINGDGQQHFDLISVVLIFSKTHCFLSLFFSYLFQQGLSSCFGKLVDFF